MTRTAWSVSSQTTGLDAPNTQSWRREQHKARLPQLCCQALPLSHGHISLPIFGFLHRLVLPVSWDYSHHMLAPDPFGLSNSAASGYLFAWILAFSTALEEGTLLHLPAQEALLSGLLSPHDEGDRFRHCDLVPGILAGAPTDDFHLQLPSCAPWAEGEAAVPPLLLLSRLTTLTSLSSQYHPLPP